MKKIISFLLALCVILSTVTGCSNQEKSTETGKDKIETEKSEKDDTINYDKFPNRNTMAVTYHNRMVSLGADGTLNFAHKEPKTYGSNDGYASLENVVSVACQDSCFFALLSDGTVYHEFFANMEPDEDYFADVSKWSDIIAIAADDLVVGLKSDGTVVGACATADSYVEGLETWADIVKIDAGGSGVIGLKSDGTVMIKNYTKMEMLEWTDIVDVSVHSDAFVGIKSDGTVVRKGGPAEYAQVETWTDIVKIDVGRYHILGLKKDGSVVSTDVDYAEKNDRGQTEIDSWNNIFDIYTTLYGSIGLKKDGTIVWCGEDIPDDDMEKWGAIQIP